MVKKEDLIIVKKFKNNLSKKIKIDKLIFFGSRITGKRHKYSDFDLIIVSKNFKGKKFRYRPIGFYEDWGVNYPVDFLCYTPEEFKKLSKQVTIVNHAIKEGIEI